MNPGKAGDGTRNSRLLTAAVLIVISLGCGLLLTGCNASQVRTPRMSDSWSKGLPLGMASLNNQVAFQVDDEGGVYAAWVDLDRELHFVRLDERAGIVVDRALDLEVDRPLQPRLALDSDGQLHLTWLDKREQTLQLFYARLSTDGEVFQGATAISSPEQWAASGAMALDPVGRTVELFWSDSAPARPGVYHASLDWGGTVVVPAELLVADGLGPQAQTDRQGFVHLAWRVEPAAKDQTLHYAVYDPIGRRLGPYLMVGRPFVLTSVIGWLTSADRADGPWLGLDEDSVYLAWVVEVREQGLLLAFTFYQAFPQPILGSRDDAAAVDYVLPDVTAKPVQVLGVDPSVTGDPRFLAGQPARQGLAFYTQAEGPGDQEMLQSAVLGVQVGQTAGLEVVSATSGASVKPNVAVDGQGHLHLVWIDTAGFDQYRVIYASTAPRVQEVLNRITAGEVTSRILELGFGALTLIGLVPLFLMWAIPGFLLLLVFYLATQEGVLDQPRAAIALWAAIAVHLVVTVATAGSVLDRLDAGGLLTTPWLASVARWVAPLLITGLAALVMTIYIRRGSARSIFASFFVFVLVDAILFSLVYLTPLLLMR